MTHPRIYAAFHNSDAQGRLRLNCRGTLDDLNRQQVTLSDGPQVTRHSEDVEAEGDVVFSADEKLWTAVIDWNAVRRFDDVERPTAIEGDGA